MIIWDAFQSFTQPLLSVTEMYICGVCDQPDEYRNGVESFEIRGYGIIETCGSIDIPCASKMKSMLALAPGSIDDKHIWFVKSHECTNRHYFKSLDQLTEWTKSIPNPNSYQYAVSRRQDVNDIICKLWSGISPTIVIGEYKTYIPNNSLSQTTILWFVPNGRWVCYKFFFGQAEISKFIKKHKLKDILFLTDEGESENDHLFFLANETKLELEEDGSDDYGNTSFISGWTCLETLLEDWRHGKFLQTDTYYPESFQWTVTKKFIAFQQEKEEAKIQHAQQQLQLLSKLDSKGF